jgi:hypothetical protein
MVELDRQGMLLTLRYLPPYVADDERAYLDALVEIGRSEEPFALLAVFAGGGKLSQAGEREQALWFKATRESFSASCRAVAMVRPGATEKMLETFRRLWPMPMTVTANERDARHFLSRHMGEA